MVFSWPCSNLSPQGAGSSHLFSHGIIHDWAWNSASKWFPWFLSGVLCVEHFGAFNLVQVSDTDFPYGLLIFLPKTISSQREGLSIIYSFFSSEEGGRGQIGENEIPSSNHDHSQGTTKRPLRLSSVEQKTPQQPKKSLGSQDSCAWNQGQKPRRKSFVLFSDLRSYTQSFKKKSQNLDLKSQSYTASSLFVKCNNQWKCENLCLFSGLFFFIKWWCCPCANVWFMFQCLPLQSVGDRNGWY